MITYNERGGKIKFKIYIKYLTLKASLALKLELWDKIPYKIGFIEHYPLFA